VSPQSFNNEVTNQLATVKINAPQNAGQNPSTTKPRKILPTNQKSKALITNVNRPKVKMLIGNVKNIKIGLIIALTKPKTKAASNADPQPATEIPGR